jgi:hypothetical protein
MFFTRMRHEEALDLPEAGVDVFSERLQFGVLLLRNFESTFQHRAPALRPVLGLVRVAPVSNQELEKSNIVFEL